MQNKIGYTLYNCVTGLRIDASNTFPTCAYKQDTVSFVSCDTNKNMVAKFNVTTFSTLKPELWCWAFKSSILGAAMHHATVSNDMPK